MYTIRLLSRFVFLLLISCLLVQPTQGQNLLKRLSDKAKKKVEKQIEDSAEKKMDEKIDEGFEKIENSLENDNDADSTQKQTNATQKRMQGMLEGFGISSEPVAYNQMYKFDHLIQMHIESFNKAGKITDKGDIITHFNPETNDMAYEVISGNLTKSGQGMFIFDTNNGAMIMLSDEKGEKTGMVYGMGSFFESVGKAYNEEVDLSESPETYLANPNVKKTGKTKKIAGLHCEEYLYTDENTKTEVWITKDLKMNSRDFFSTIFKASLYSHGMAWGYMMELNSLDKSTGEKSTMTVTKVDENSNVLFKLNEYQITNLGSLQIPGSIE